MMNLMLNIFGRNNWSGECLSSIMSAADASDRFAIGGYEFNHEDYPPGTQFTKRFYLVYMLFSLCEQITKGFLLYKQQIIREIIQQIEIPA